MPGKYGSKRKSAVKRKTGMKRRAGGKKKSHGAKKAKTASQIVLSGQRLVDMEVRRLLAGRPDDDNDGVPDVDDPDDDNGGIPDTMDTDSAEHPQNPLLNTRRDQKVSLLVQPAPSVYIHPAWESKVEIAKSDFE